MTTTKKRASSTKKPITKTPPKPLSDSNEKFTDLYQNVSISLFKCEPFLLAAKAEIANTELLKPNSKKSLVMRIQTIFDEANAIVEKIGQLGKVK